MRRLPPKAKAGKIRVIRVTKQGQQRVTYERGTTTRGKKNIKGRKPQKKNKKTGLAAWKVDT